MVAPVISDFNGKLDVFDLSAIVQKNARLLYSINTEYARNYCEACDKLYCGEHWKIFPIMDDDWCDGFVWTCPRRHRKEF